MGSLSPVGRAATDCRTRSGPVVESSRRLLLTHRGEGNECPGRLSRSSRPRAAHRWQCGYSSTRATLAARQRIFLGVVRAEIFFFPDGDIRTLAYAGTRDASCIEVHKCGPD